MVRVSTLDPQCPPFQCQRFAQISTKPRRFFISLDNLLSFNQRLSTAKARPSSVLWISLALRQDKKEAHVSQFILPRLDNTSLYFRSTLPTISISTQSRPSFISFLFCLHHTVRNPPVRPGGRGQRVHFRARFQG